MNELNYRLALIAIRDKILSAHFTSADLVTDIDKALSSETNVNPEHIRQACYRCRG